MTCHFGNGIVICTTDTFVNLEPYGAKVWCDFHNYCGPTFYRSENAIKPIECPSQKTWNAFEKWHKEYAKAKEKHQIEWPLKKRIKELESMLTIVLDQFDLSLEDSRVVLNQLVESNDVKHTKMQSDFITTSVKMIKEAKMILSKT